MAVGPQAGRVVARKRFGQHFLTDRAAIEAIVAAIDPRPGDHLVGGDPAGLVDDEEAGARHGVSGSSSFFLYGSASPA